jgi:hypothetical protein
MSDNIEILFAEMNNDVEYGNNGSFISITAGSRNEEGFVNGLNRKGFIPTKCGAEKIANCIDAYADNIRFRINSSYILLCDDGIGMTSEKLCNMFDANRENHSADKSMGVSGIGGIISNYQLSKGDDGTPREVTVFTKNMRGPYIKATIPWDSIHTNKKYDGQIKIELMNEDEINQFISERQTFTNLTGTTIRFSYSESFRKLLCSQFISKQEDGRNLENWWTIIFGKTKTNILLDNSNGLPPIPLKKYDYFCGFDTEFYCSKYIWLIYFIIDNGKYRFVSKNPDYPDRYIEITQNGNGFSKEPKPINIDPRKIENAQIIKLTCGMRKDNRVFNPEDPLNEKSLSATFYLNDYDEKFMSESGQKDVIKEFSSKTRVIRNSQSITAFTLEGCSVSSARGNSDTLIKNALHRSEVSYETFSKQDNSLDIVHGIQENKNQNQNEFPTQYVRLINYLKRWHYDQIMNYFKEVKELEQKKINDERRMLQEQKKAEQERIKAEQERIKAEQKAEEDRKKAEQERIKAEQKTEEDRKKAEQERVRAEQKAEESESNSEEEIEDSQEEDDDEEEIEDSQEEDDDEEEIEDSQEEDDDEEEIEDSQEEDNKVEKKDSQEEDNKVEKKDSQEEVEDMNKVIAESREWVKKAAQVLMEHAAGINYNEVDGKEIYEFIMQRLNKK